MTCAECLDVLVTTDLRSLSGGRSDTDDSGIAELSAHLTECSKCARAAELMIAGERALAASLAEQLPARSSVAVAELAWARAHRAKLRRWIIVGSVVILLSLIGLAVRSVLPDIRRVLAPPPTLVTATFTLTCLSSEQAAVLLQPYLPIARNPRWQAEWFSVTPARYGIRAVTVRAPQETIDRVPALLQRFEKDPNAACRRGR